MAEFLPGAPVAERLTQDLKARSDALRQRGVAPTLAIIRVGRDPGGLAYEKGAASRCAKCGIDLRHIPLDDAASLPEVIRSVNDDPAIHGCLLLRPGKVMQMDNPENPRIMEDFIRAIGAEPVLWANRNECCGGYISLKEKEMSGRMSCNIVDSAAGAGAEMLITACPLCMYNLNKSGSGKIPVYYFTELLAEALGVKEEALK